VDRRGVILPHISQIMRCTGHPPMRVNKGLDFRFFFADYYKRRGMSP